MPSAEVSPPANMRQAPTAAASRNASREEVSIAAPTEARSAPPSLLASSPPARGRDFADETTWAACGERRSPERWLSSVEANWLEITAPIAAIARSPATLATALFTPEAIPALCSSTAFSTVVVKGATVAESPSPKTTRAGRTSVA